eukprot:358298-Chlamydomonas_euryale.AAC.6
MHARMHGCTYITAELKEGCPLMCLKNINPKVGLMNGTRLISRSAGTKLFGAKLLQAAMPGRLFSSCAFASSVPSPEETPIQFARLQFPVWPALAMNITTTAHRPGARLRNEA